MRSGSLTAENTTGIVEVVALAASGQVAAPPSSVAKNFLRPMRLAM
jgi:hypothetical protein